MQIVVVYLNNFNGCTTCPDLRRAFGVPSEGEDIFTMSKRAWNVNNINDVAVASLVHATLLHVGVDGVSSPHGAGRIGTLSCPLGSHLLPKQALQLGIPFIRENTSMENNKANLVFAAS